MNKEYVVISKTDIENKINNLELIITNGKPLGADYIEMNVLKQIICESTPLEPIIEHSFDAGSAYCLGSHELFKQTHPNKQEYIANLKLDI